MRLVVACLALLVLAAPAQAAGWKPGIEAAKRYAATRPGVVSFAVRDGGRLYGRQTWRKVPAASLMKTMLLAAYLRHGDVRRRPLRAGEKRMLGPMIRSSDNAAANRVLGIVGLEGELAIARAARMKDFTPFTVWGMSHTSARDQASLFLRLRRILPNRHEPYAMRLLRTIVPHQRWGVGRVQPHGWRLYFKGGWGSRSGAVNHQAALLERGRRRIALAITTMSSGSHAAGTATLRGVARRLLRKLR